MCVCVGRPVVKSVVPLVEWRSEVILFTIVLLTWQAAGRVDSRSVSLSAESLVDYDRGSGGWIWRGYGWFFMAGDEFGGLYYGIGRAEGVTANDLWSGMNLVDCAN